MFLSVAYYYGATVLAVDSEFSATPDYSYGSYRSRDAYNTSTSYSFSRRDNNSSSRTFSSNIMVKETRSQSGFSPQPVRSNANANPQYSSNPAYYRTHPYNY